jgi:ferredoxin-thioredoxin reductase catalytic subunit
MNPSPSPNPRKMPDELAQQLAYLKLQFMQEHCEELAKQAAQHQWSHVDFLRRLIEGEGGRNSEVGGRRWSCPFRLCSIGC